MEQRQTLGCECVSERHSVVPDRSELWEVISHRCSVQGVRELNEPARIGWSRDCADPGDQGGARS